MKRALVLLLLAACSGDQPVSPVQPLPHPTIRAARPPSTAAPRAKPLAADVLAAHVNYLASTELAGRKAGSKEEAQATDYVAQKLREVGLTAERQAFPIREGGESHNLHVMVAGNGAHATEAVVLGAHLDHLGVVDGAMYPGAEDDASGVAVVLEITRVLVERRAEIDRSVLVVFFGAEEIGLVGSKAFVATPPIPRERIVAMINVDMIGRPLADQGALALPKSLFGIDGDHSFGILGTRNRPGFRRVVTTAAADVGIRAIGIEDLPGPIAEAVDRMSQGRGDNASFENAGIPTLFFGSGESDDYHQPTDTADKIRGDIMAARAEVILRTVIAFSRLDAAELKAAAAAPP
jgi:Zn-dependent M28 family amino/carboxypeptidase